MTLRLSALFEERAAVVLRNSQFLDNSGRRTRRRTYPLQSPEAGTTSSSLVSPPHESTRPLPSVSSSGRGSHEPAVPITNVISSSRARTNSMRSLSASTADEADTPRTRASARISSRSARTHDESDDEREVHRPSREITARSSRRPARDEPVSSSVRITNGHATRYSTRRQSAAPQGHAQQESDSDQDDDDEDRREGDDEGQEEDDEGQEEDDEGQEEDDEGQEEDDEGQEEESESESDTEDSSEESDNTSRRPQRATPLPRKSATPQARPVPRPKGAAKRASAKRNNKTNLRKQTPVAETAPSRTLRSRSTRTVRYDDSDSESEAEREDDEEELSPDAPIMGVSSRGRLRRMTVRMVDYVE